jgi:hypothetical protein
MTHNDADARESSRNSVRESIASSDVVEQGEALLDGADPCSVDPALLSQIVSYLRATEAECLRGTRPNYARAQKAEDVCEKLLLLMNQQSYCDYKRSEVDRLQKKLAEARMSVQSVLDERDRVFGHFNNRRERSIAALREQQLTELQAHDAIFEGEMPQRYRHASAEVLQMREQERYLRQARRYIEAQKMLEEADAVEAFELERQKVRWLNEGVDARELIVAAHETQMQCLIEKWDRTWQAMIVGSLARESQCRAVVEHIEAQIRHESGESHEAQMTTRTLIGTKPGLPPLGPSGPKTIRKVTTSNNQRAYTKYAHRRVYSSFR